MPKHSLHPPHEPKTPEGTSTTSRTDEPLFLSAAWALRGLNGESYTFDFAELNVSAHLAAIAKELVLSYCKEDKDRSLICSEWSMFRVKRTIKVLHAILTQEHFTHIRELPIESIEKMLLSMLKGYYDDGQLIAFSTYQMTVNTCFKLRDLFLSRRVSDGFSVMPSLDRCLVLAEEAIASTDKDYITWVAGSNLGGMPMSLLILLLSDAIAVMHSDETKYLLAFFEYQKNLAAKSEPFTVDKTIQKNVPRASSLDRIQRYFLSEESKRFRKKSKSIVCVLPEYCVAECQVSSTDELPLQRWPFKGARGLSRHLHCVYEAGYIIFACVTGARRSELEHLLVSDLIERTDGAYYFRSLMCKTNHGIPTIRSVHGLAADVVSILERLSLENKRDLKLPLFSAPRGMFVSRSNEDLPQPNMTNLVNEQNARYILKNYIAKRFLKIHPGLETELNNINITPHRFRHAFAEFALRRFDGNVPELIRRHFRHHYKSFMTSLYTFGKIHIGETYTQAQMGRNYLEELGLNWLSGSEDLFGPIGIAIKKKVQDIKFLPEDELQGELSKWINTEFTGEIKAMEYGFCALRFQTVTKANCGDKLTGAPRLEEASMTVCSGCPHLLSIGSQRQDIIRIGQSILEQQKTYKRLGITPLLNACHGELKRAEAMLKMIGAEGYKHEEL